MALDVLGIAPIDRLGELTWLGPARVVIFGFVLPAAAILALTLVAAIHTRLQGILITGTSIGVFIVACC